MSNAPITFFQDFVKDPLQAFVELRDGLEWERRGDTPRYEYYCNDFPDPYTYGRGKGQRLYEPRPYHPRIIAIRTELEKLAGAAFEVCFLNYYKDGRDQLGWHADDSPEMDDVRPIAVVSLGSAREIWFREKPQALIDSGEQRSGDERRWHERATVQRREDPPPKTKLLLTLGSLCLMAPGMQDTHQHRIPKAAFDCGPRISLTFRGYVNAR